MCDYSLDLVASRPAKVGDELVTTMFENSMTRDVHNVTPRIALQYQCVEPHKFLIVGR